MTRAEFQAQCEAEQAEYLRKLEWSHITHQLEALYGAQAAGDSSGYTRQRITRLEALQQALMGLLGALAA
ncbi:hypothetical protein [Streptomyces sp. NPDC006855]|uniref:hypothetical protein n=1 Tax=Streptomyces sp. NPDC006855 TaxID=3364765 RepID=UPI0036777C70